jgi:hypothetical protein
MLIPEILLTRWSNSMFIGKMISTGRHNLRVCTMPDKMISFSELPMLALTTVMNILETVQDSSLLLLLIEFM